jgi:hypothetical protein
MKGCLRECIETPDWLMMLEVLLAAIVGTYSEWEISSFFEPSNEAAAAQGTATRQSFGKADRFS